MLFFYATYVQHVMTTGKLKNGCPIAMPHFFNRQIKKWLSDSYATFFQCRFGLVRISTSTFAIHEAVMTAT